MWTYNSPNFINGNIFCFNKSTCLMQLAYRAVLQWRVTLWLYYSDVQYSVYITLHRSSDAAQWRARKTWNPKDLRLLVRASGAPLFFLQQCSPVGIDIFTGEDSQSEWMKRDESNRVYWFQTRFLSLVYL